MKWTEYGKELLLKRSVEERFYMLDDIVLWYMIKQDRPLRREELCSYLSDFTEIDIREVRDNIDAVLSFLIRCRQIERKGPNTFVVRPDAPQSLSPLNDNIGSHPDRREEKPKPAEQDRTE